MARNLFYLQDITEERKVKALSYEWTKYPSSLFEPDEDMQQGYRMRKGCKSLFFAAVKESMAQDWVHKDEPPSGSNSIYIIDALVGWLFWV